MAIDKERFEELGYRKRDDSTLGTNATKILDFLRENPDEAFHKIEIAAETDARTSSLGLTLVRLRQRGQIDRRGNYWRVSNYD